MIDTSREGCSTFKTHHALCSAAHVACHDFRLCAHLVLLHMPCFCPGIWPCWSGCTRHPHNGSSIKQGHSNRSYGVVGCTILSYPCTAHVSVRHDSNGLG